MRLFDMRETKRMLLGCIILPMAKAYSFIFIPSVAFMTMAWSFAGNTSCLAIECCFVAFEYVCCLVFILVDWVAFMVLCLRHVVNCRVPL